MDKSFVAAEIKRRAKMPELFRLYGFDVRQSRLACPIHAGTNRSMGVKDDFCHCFKCGYSADVIGFVRDYFSLSFEEALTKINDDLGLGINIGERLDARKRRELAKQAFLKKKEVERKKEEKDKLFVAVLDAQEEFIRLHRQMVKYSPTSFTEQLHPKFVEAIKNIEYVKYALSCAEQELFEYEQANG